MPELQLHQHLISWMTFLPAVGALLLFALRRMNGDSLRATALFFSLTPLPPVIRMLLDFDRGATGLQFRERVPWIDFLNIDYFVGVDGISVAMVALVSIVVPLAILASYRWTGNFGTNSSLKTFFALILLEQTGLYGAFTALNFFHWFIFWEVSLIPMFFLIKLFGQEDRSHAAFLFFTYTFVGSVAMLIGMQFIYLATHTWNFPELAALASTPSLDGGSELMAMIQEYALDNGGVTWSIMAPTVLFWLIFLGFAVKVPIWPLHTWLPTTYTQAPTSASMLLTGLMSKMGLYGILRIVLPLFSGILPSQQPVLLVLSLATILFGAWASYSQRDIKSLIAYSSISHLGYCLFGLFTLGSLADNIDARALVLNGVIVQMVAHGLSASGLFFFAGVLEQRTGTRDMQELGGLRRQTPVMCGMMGMIVFASLGLPGLAGFVGEYMIFQGSFPLMPGLTLFAVFGILLTALYLLKMLSTVFFGPAKERWMEIPDLTVREKCISMVCIVLLFAAGLVPAPIIQLSNTTVTQLARLFY